MKTDLMGPKTKLSIQSRFYGLEKNYQEAREHCAHEHTAYVGSSAKELNITYTLQTVLTSRQNGQWTELFDAVRDLLY